MLAVSDSERLLLVPARLEVFKGLLDLAAALKALGSSKRLVVVLAGSGSLESELRRRLEGFPVRFAGQVPDEEMPCLYAAADVMVLPSRQDPSPLSVVEALRCGLPIVVSDAVGNASEAVVSGENGWVFRVGDIQQLARVLAEIDAIPSSRLAAMGVRSSGLHEEFFHTGVVVPRVADELMTLARKRPVRNSTHQQSGTGVR
jgi:glycosyltransferase involved in cell wall biosynthesis